MLGQNPRERVVETRVRQIFEIVLCKQKVGNLSLSLYIYICNRFTYVHSIFVSRLQGAAFLCVRQLLAPKQILNCVSVPGLRRTKKRHTFWPPRCSCFHQTVGLPKRPCAFVPSVRASKVCIRRRVPMSL